MSTATVPSPLQNRGTVVPAEVLREAEFLDKLLQIRDDVLASKHPRIRLPAKVIEQVAPRFQQTTARPTTNGVQKDTPYTPSQPIARLPKPSPQHAAPPTPPAQRSLAAAKAAAASSSIDPVLLTKSDHLINAELQLKRQQIERLLKDQFDKKGRNNDTDEREAYINVEECLTQAHLRVPPISGLQSTTNNSDDAESFDENSYYSSKANSWSSDEADANQNGNLDPTSPIVLHPKQNARQATAQSRFGASAVIDLDEEAYEPADDIEIYEPESALRLEDAEEEDYSPPPADILSNELPKGRTRDRGIAGYGDTNGLSNQHSPSGPAAPVQNPRKRRREEKQADKRRRQQQQPANRRTMHSPEPYIKDEPQSPPPFSAYPDSQPRKRPALQQPFANDVEVVSTPERVRPQPVVYREQEPSSSGYRVYEEPSSPTTVHSPQRKARRDDQDLRRVASLQYARRPYSPGSNGADVFAAPSPHQNRALSHTFAERPEAPFSRDNSTRPPPAQRFVREQSRSPVHEYLPRELSPMIMAPPPRRIVVDQFGNKYYAAPVEPVEPSTPVRRVEMPPYQERGATRDSARRALPPPEIYEEEIVQRMPPPRRRYGEASDFEVIERPPRQREASRRPVEVEYRPMPMYEEQGPPREYAPPRAYSMRPEVIRREIPVGHTRHESIQPGSVRVSQPRYREVSIVHQEPLDNRPYISAPQSRRYVEEAPIDMAQEPYPAVYTRY